MGTRWTVIFNSLAGLISVLTYYFCIDNIEDVFDSDTGQPYIEVLLVPWTPTLGL